MGAAKREMGRVRSSAPFLNVSIGRLHFMLGWSRYQCGFQWNRHWRTPLGKSDLFQVHRLG